MLSNNNKNDGSYKHYYRTPDTYKDFVDQARRCNQCKEPTIVEYSLRTHKVETYELDPYPDQRINHRHPADNITKASVVSAIAVEKRYLFEKRRGDYDSVSGTIVK
jgi:hypothetical protein